MPAPELEPARDFQMAEFRVLAELARRGRLDEDDAAMGRVN